MSALDMPDFGPARETVPLRVLVIAPAHVELSPGRTSQAADNLLRQLKRRGLDASLLATAPKDFLASGMRMAAYQHRADEMLVAFPEIDAFSLTSRDAAVRDRLMADILDHFQPDVVHFQHISQAGLDACGAVKGRGIPVVLTLQDDIAVLPAAAGDALQQDGADPAKLFGRRRLLQLNLSDVDALVVPHRPLAERLASFSAGQIQVIANPGDPDGRRPRGGLPAMSLPEEGPASTVTGPRLLKARRQAVRQLRIGVFVAEGDVAQTAMIGEAMEMLPASHRRRLRVVLHRAPHWAGADDDAAGQSIPVESVSSNDLRAAIAGCDWAVIPSLEEAGSLQVFGEAVSLGVPFLHPGRDDLPNAAALGSIAFDPDAVAHLAHCLLGIADRQSRDDDGRQAARRQADVEAVDDYVDLYRHLAAGRVTHRR